MFFTLNDSMILAVNITNERKLQWNEYRLYTMHSVYEHKRFTLSADNRVPIIFTPENRNKK